MDNETILEQFDAIEKKVEHLIGVCQFNQHENSELLNKINSLEEELRGKTEAENKYAEEKALIRSKIDGLMAKLDKMLQD